MALAQHVALALLIAFAVALRGSAAHLIPQPRAAQRVQASAAVQHGLTQPHLPRVAGTCPCSNTTLCKPLATPLPQREVFTFHVSHHTTAWKYFDWSLVTTVCVYGRVDPELLCKAHSVGARISVATGWNSQAEITNATARAVWVADRVAQMQSVGADGINMDFENSLAQGSPNVTGLTLAMAELQAAARAVNPLAQITFDAPVRPDYEGRFYNFTGLAQSLDFFVLMAYDLNDYSDPPPDNDGSMANSPYWVDAMGLVAFQDIGVPVSKLVMALPWYGYDYVCDPAVSPPCVNSSAVLSIFNSEIPFNVLMDVLRANGTDREWCESAQSPYFSYPYRVSALDAAALAATGVRARAGDLITRQIWYDNPYSLMLRFKLARSASIRGVGMWTGDKLSYDTDDPTTAAMWEAVRNFFPPPPPPGRTN